MIGSENNRHVRDLLSLLSLSLGGEMSHVELSRLNWGGLIQASGMHGLALVVYKIIMECRLERHVNSKTLEDLRLNYLHSYARGRLMMARWFPIQEALQKNGVRFVHVKGQSLVHLIYGGDFGCKRSKDVDLIVHRDSFDKFCAVAAQNGALREHSVREGVTLPLEFRDIFPKSNTDLMAFSWKGLLLDVSTDPFLFSNRHADELDFLAGSATCIDMLGQLPVPRATMHLLALAFHTFIHKNRNLKRFYEIARFIHLRSPEIDWNEIRALKKTWLAPVAYTIFSICKRRFPVDVPHEVTRDLQSVRATLLGRAVRVDPYPRPLPFFTPSALDLHLAKCFLLTSRSIGEQMSFLSNLAWPKRSRLDKHLHGKIPHLQYWWRVLRIVFRSLSGRAGNESRESTESWEHPERFAEDRYAN